MHHIPKGYNAVTPYLIIDGAVEAIDFYTAVFGAVEIERMPGANGKVGHSELRIGESMIFLADESPEMGARSPKSVGGTPVSMVIYVPDVDAVVHESVKRGAKLLHPIEDKFYGDRSGTIADPFGHNWTISTHVKDVSQEEMIAAAQALANERERKAKPSP